MLPSPPKNPPNGFGISEGIISGILGKSAPGNDASMHVSVAFVSKVLSIKGEVDPV